MIYCFFTTVNYFLFQVAVKNDSLETQKKIEDNLIMSMDKVKIHLRENHKLIVNSLPNLSKIKAYYGKQIKEISSEIENDFGSISSTLNE